MRLLVFIVLISVMSPALSQSKKQLLAEKKALQDEASKLKSEIEQMKKPKEVELNNLNKKACYGIGIFIASNIKMQGLDSLDIESIITAMQDVLLNRTVKMDRAEAEQVVQSYMQQAMEAKSKVARAEGQAFLDANKTKEGVKTTASGLQYKYVKEGKGKTPAATDKATVHYTGKLIDGTTFDSSVERGAPATFSCNGVIAGWTEALQLMKEGDKCILYIPYDLAYGERGSPPQIPPYSTLIFEVELLKVN
jgi:FKBP-type peptidyl-prolyl cis-trans isomerase